MHSRLHILFAFLWPLFSLPTHAALFLEAGNSQLEIDGDPPDGWVTGWWVDADNGEIDTTENHLTEMTWWIRLPGATNESFLHDELSLSSTTTNTATFTYQAGNLDGTLHYRLDGGAPASGISKFTQSFTLTNNGTESLNFSLFQYTDLDVNFFSDDDIARYTGPGTITQADLVDGVETTTITTTAQGVLPTAWAIATAPDILSLLEDDSATHLGSFPDELAGDAEFAFQWDIQLQPGQSVTLETVHAVPIPPAIWLLGSAFTMLVGYTSRKRIFSEQSYQP